MRLIIFLLALSACNLFEASVINVVCSSRITPLNDLDRAVTYNSNSNLCDNAVSGFYSLSANTIFPNQCPKKGDCSANRPVWLPDASKLPTAVAPGPVTISLCASVSTTGLATDPDCKDDCSITADAYYCANLGYIVYELKPVPYCFMRYCTLELIPCNADESSATGYQPCQKPFPFNRLTNGTTTYAGAETDQLFTNIAGISLKCVLKCPTGLDCSQLTGEVYWYSTISQSMLKAASLLYDSTNRELYSFIEETDWTPQINNYFYCDIIPKTAQGLRPLFHLYTEAFYAGLVLQVKDTTGVITTYKKNSNNLIQFIMHEAGTSAEVIVYSTIPIYCKGTKGCELPIMMTRESVNDDLIRTSNCNPTYTCGGCVKMLASQSKPDPSINIKWNLFATVEPGNLQVFPLDVYLPLYVKNDPRVSGNFWANALLPKLKITYIPKNLPIKKAYSQNDPHLRSIDGTDLEFRKDGEYVMLENPITLLWIHSVNTRCNVLYRGGYSEPVYCNDRVYIQSIDDVIIHDIRKPDFLFYTYLSSTGAKPVELLFKDGVSKIASKDDPISVFDDGPSYRIITHFGTTIVIHKYDGNYYVYPGKYDKYMVNGVLGDYDDNPANDFRLTKYGRVTNDNDFVEIFRVLNTANEVRPEMSKGAYYSLTKQQINNAGDLQKYCRCTKDQNDLNFKCTLGLTTADIISSPIYRIKRIGKPNVNLEINQEKIEYLAGLIGNFNLGHSTKSLHARYLHSRAKKAASSSCVSVLNITALLDCEKVNIINLTATIKLCEFDFNSTGADIWAEGYLNYALTTCKMLLTNDHTNYLNSTNGTLVPNVAITKNLCPNNCSNNGNCTERSVCQCKFPFDGTDCSIDMSIPAKIYNTSSLNDICDQKNASCSDLLLLVSRSSTSLSLHYDIFYKTSNGTFAKLGNGTSDVLYYNQYLLYGQLITSNTIPNGSLSVYFFSLTVRDNSTSNPIMYAIINGECHECTNSTNCTVKADKCDINGICYQNGAINPDDSTKKCDSTQKVLAWSEVTTTGSQSQLATILGATLGTIGGIVVIAGVILVFLTIKARSFGFPKSVNGK